MLACPAVAIPVTAVTAGVHCSGHPCYTCYCWRALQWPPLLHLSLLACTAVAAPVTPVTAGVHCSGHPCYTCHCWRALQWPPLLHLSLLACTAVAPPVTPVTAGVHCSGHPCYFCHCWRARRVVATCTGRAGPRRRAAAGEGLHRRQRALQLRRVGRGRLVDSEWCTVNVVMSIL